MFNIWKNIATLGPIGYFKAPGTLASLVALPFVSALYQVPFYSWQLILILVGSTFGSLKILNKIMPYFNYEDSSHIVIDEVVGLLYTFWNIDLTLPLIMMGFVLFRFFDITKVLGIRYLEKKIPNPSGIVVDDIVAGLFANFILRILNLYEIL